MKRYIFLVVLLCYPALTSGQQTLSTIPFSTTSSTTIPFTTTTVGIRYCYYTEDCEDYNPCSHESCGIDYKCSYYNNPQAPCDDGLYCNGTDTCSDVGMVCSDHSGNPCPIGTLCNEDTDSCDVPPLSSITTTSNQGTTTSTSIINGTSTTSTSQGTTSTSTVGGSLSISGYVTGAVNEDVSVMLGGTASETSITDTDGYYEFLNLAGGYYTVTPIKDGYGFEPPNYVIPNLVSVLVEMNFRARKAICPAVLIYGEDSEETRILRYLRDSLLNKTHEGRELIKLYYQWSPIIVRAMGADEEFKQEVKDIMDEIVPSIEIMIEYLY
jgi:hypothetical protein